MSLTEQIDATEDLISPFASLFFGYVRNISKYISKVFSSKIQICLFLEKDEQSCS